MGDERSYNQEESAYPYTSGRTGDVTSCRPSSSGYNKNFKVTGMHNQWFTNERDMETMLLQNPVITAVQANSDWSYYNGGVLDSRQCCNAASDSSCIYNLNHAVLVVGYGRQSGQDYWLIKFLGQKLGRERIREGEEGHRPLRRRLPPPDRPYLPLNQNLTLPPKIVSHPGKKTMFEKFIQ